MKVCPKCGKLLAYNSYFGAYICGGCNWEDATKGKLRSSRYTTIGKIMISKNSKPMKEAKKSTASSRSVLMELG